MLGEGRPFICEFVNPRKRHSALEKISTFSDLMKSDEIFCFDLKVVDKKFFDELKAIENSKAKSYCCIVWTKRRINQKDMDRLNVL